MTSNTPQHWIVVPCYNEADRLDGDAFASFAAAHSAVGFCFVNDGSADRTEAVLEQLVRRVPGSFMMLSLADNRGKAEAVRAGVQHVLVERRPDWVGYWDADLATPLDEIPRFLAEAACRPDCVMVLGSRVRRIGARVRRSNARHYLGRVFATFASLMLGLPIYDTQCGAKIIRAGLAAELFAEPFLTRWLFDVELFARLNRRYGREGAERMLLELPLLRWEEVGDSRVRLVHFLRAPIELLRIRRAYGGPRAGAADDGR